MTIQTIQKPEKFVEDGQKGVMILENVMLSLENLVVYGNKDCTTYFFVGE